MAKKKTEKPVDLNTEILRQIRDGITQLETRLSGRIDATNERLDALRDDTSEQLGAVKRALADAEMRLASEIVALVGTVRDVRDMLLRQQIDRVVERLEALEKKAAS